MNSGNVGLVPNSAFGANLAYGCGAYSYPDGYGGTTVYPGFYSGILPIDTSLDFWAFSLTEQPQFSTYKEHPRQGVDVTSRGILKALHKTRESH